MKTSAVLFAAFVATASAFAPATPDRSVSSTTTTTSLSAESVPLANGAMSFNRVCREWRCKYEGDKGTSKSLEAIANAVEEFLPDIKKASKDITVNRLVCGSCLDFKLMMTVPLEDFGPWEESGFAPEKEFLDKIKAIDGVSQVETQTITNMEI
ncbi:hypothetical protein IV203_029871 [Nitzschia inconspicua]|uniref:Uncharacterized protein n=1 Tax=Nitzschia inconspicua TaxID=303405 RepID=A0A9K3LV25_9STRA|nr:hypothetical protein IV203_029871 [Nitzschia inconspicua]